MIISIEQGKEADSNKTVFSEFLEEVNFDEKPREEIIMLADERVQPDKLVNKTFCGYLSHGKKKNWGYQGKHDHFLNLTFIASDKLHVKYQYSNYYRGHSVESRENLSFEVSQSSQLKISGLGVELEKACKNFHVISDLGLEIRVSFNATEEIMQMDSDRCINGVYARLLPN